MQDLLCFANDRFQPVLESGVSLQDLGVLRGYGIFDFLRVSEGVPLFLDDHLDRFFYSADVMGLEVKKSRHALTMIVHHLIKENKLKNSGIRLLLTGGDSVDGYQLGEPNLVVVQLQITPPADSINHTGFVLASYAYQRQLSEVKTTDYLMAIWLQPWMKKKHADDILYHHNGMVNECPRSNVFIVTQQNQLITPAENMLKGITRKNIFKISKAIGMPVVERNILLEEIKLAKEVFITSSTKRIVPISQLDETVYPPYTPNSVTWKLFELLCEHERQYIHAEKD